MAGDDILTETAGPLVASDTIEEAAPLLGEAETVDKNQIEIEQAEFEAEQAEEEELSSRALVTVFVSLYVGIFLAALDGTIVATLLAHIASEFNELRSVSWIATGYMISVAAVQPIYGKISDIYGRKAVLIACNITFGVGSVLCGLAPSFWFLVGARILTGIGGGGLTSLTAITLSDIVPLRQRGVLQGIGNILWGCGAAFGGVVGGIITEAFGWRWAFLSQGPIIALSIVTITFNLHLPVKEVDGSKLKRIDFLGSFTLVMALVSFLLTASIGGVYFPWFSIPVFMSLLISILFFVGFLFVELRVAKEPIIPLHLLKDPTVFGSSFTSWFMNMIYYAQLYYIAIYFTSVRHVSPTKSGSSLIPHFLGDSVGALVVGYYMRATGRYFPMIVLAAVSLFLGSLALCFVGTETPRWLIMGTIFIPGFGFGLYLTLTLIALVAAVPREFQAVSTSIQYGFKGTGSTLGVSLSTAVFQNVLASKLYARITGPGSEEIISQVLGSVDQIGHLSPELQEIVTVSYLDAVKAVFMLATVLCVMCAGTGFMMKEHKLHNTVRR
ncbi:membrane transporter [Myxozyma melibiosi]|uniref:Membrane transporter n=1 Tax=Myxozyma melibiosi TaxID=54550 RepID=A0ABR1FFZ2_9ASCO